MFTLISALPAAEPSQIAMPLFTKRVLAGFPSPAQDYVEEVRHEVA